jgi:hypothetical protein
VTISIEVKHAERRPNMSVLALISFAFSFAVSRLFTILNPSVILITSGFHIHHFWFGILMLAIGGWLGISYDEARIDRIGAIFFGAGGGLIGDEVGILLTFRGENYWAGISYTFVIVFLALASILVLVNKYSSMIVKEFAEFSGSRGGFYLAVFIEVVSLAFLIDTNNPLIIAITGIIAVVAFFTIFSFFIQTIKRRLRRRLRRKEPKS